MALSPARWAAFRVLRRVEATGALAAELFPSALGPPLSARDAALAEQIVFGVLRRRAELDASIEALSGGRADRFDPEVRLALRIGLFQLRYLDRIPARAAVSDSVELVKRARKASAAGLVNAILRQAAASPERPAPRPEEAVPRWLLDRWRGRYGAEAEPLALATLETPPTFLRLDPAHDPARTLDLLASEGVSVEPAGLSLCYRVVSGNPLRTKAWQERRFRIQDVASQRIVPLLDVRPGQTVLDVCAAPGGKTLQIAEHRPRLLVAGDLHFRRLRQVPVRHRVTLDATRPLPFSVLFDRILADVPCSGTGTLARNPEIKWKLTPADLEDLACRQRWILRRALAQLAPGGRLVYSTCSLEPEENEEAVAAVLEPPFALLEQRLWLPTRDPGDGFFAAVIERRIPRPARGIGSRPG